MQQIQKNVNKKYRPLNIGTTDINNSYTCVSGKQSQHYIDFMDNNNSLRLIT